MRHPHSSKQPSSFPCYPRPPLNQGPELYQAVISYSHLTMLPDLKTHERALKEFLQDGSMNALFVFGPSGSGKSTLVLNHLRKNKIPYFERSEQNQSRELNFEMEDEDQIFKIVTVREQIESLLLQNVAAQVDIFTEFPISSLETSTHEHQRNAKFKTKFFRLIPSAKCKAIFLLNTQMYNSFYIFPRDLPSCVASITFKGYTNFQTKTILKDFCEALPAFKVVLSRKEELEQILQLSNGDARKAFLNVYQSYILLGVKHRSSTPDNQSLVDRKLKIKNQKRFPLFHLLGKYLYAKRYDVKTKTDRYFTRQELQSLDPPFYFDPVETFNRSLVPLYTFAQLLFENYPPQFGSMQDARKAAQLFSFINSQFPAFITGKKVGQQPQKSREIYIFLLTWGIILNNKSANLVSKGFRKYHKSSSLAVQRQINTKKQLIRHFFKNSSVCSILRFAFILRNSKCPRNFLAKNFLSKRLPFVSSLSEESGKLNDEEDSLVVQKPEGGIDEGQIRRQFKVRTQQRELEKRIIGFEQDADSDESDIDEEPN